MLGIFSFRIIVACFLNRFFTVFNSCSSSVRASREGFVLPVKKLEYNRKTISYPLGVDSFDIISIGIVLPSTQIAVTSDDSLLVCLIL